jgi:hypothetical protein
MKLKKAFRIGALTVIAYSLPGRNEARKRKRR